MALRYAGVDVEIREISLREKPQSMLLASPKGTVPVLIQPNGQVIEQSLEIMGWALNQRDVDDWMLRSSSELKSHAAALIAENDGPFKQALDPTRRREPFPWRLPLAARIEDLQGHAQDLQGHTQDLQGHTKDLQGHTQDLQGHTQC
jgi:glutathione S-transferase